MATANKVFVSPGVYTSERDLSFVTSSVGVTTLGLVGEAVKGPAFEPIFITNYDEFQTYFGGTTPEKFVNTQIPKHEMAYIAKAYLQQSNQLFVTRVLGLSGYDAGPSWSIKTIANVDSTTVGYPYSCTTSPNFSVDPAICETNCIITGTTEINVNFSGCSADLTQFAFLENFPDEIQSRINSVYTQFDGGTSSLFDDMKGFVQGILADTTLSGDSLGVWGIIPGDVFDAYTGIGFTNITNYLGTSGNSSYNCSFTSPYNDTWYYALWNPTTGNNYSGFSYLFIIENLEELPVTTTTTPEPTVTVTSTFNPCDVTPTPTATPTSTPNIPNICYSGNVVGYLFPMTGQTYEEYHNMVIATLRSRGFSFYTSTNNGPTYQVSGASNVGLDFSGSYSAATLNPFSPFAITGSTIDGANFNFKVSMSSTDSTAIERVLGYGNFTKPRTVTPLMVEEKYSFLLNDAYNKGYIRGISSELIGLPGYRQGYTELNSIGWYLERYQSSTSPWVVSELRGNDVYKLFRAISIADGNSANYQIKVSILNVSFSNQSFDLVVRDFYDTDDAPVVLEKFTNCSMDPGQNNYIAKKVGSSDGEFVLNSKFIMIDYNIDAPIDAVPCGFEGFKNRLYEGAVTPSPVFKTKYFTPGEIIYNPPFGTTAGGDDAVPASGDNVRRTYLGVSDTVGYDLDYFMYKGKRGPIDPCFDTSGDEWAYISKGFHMDSGATVVTIPSGYTLSGQPAFEVGAAAFNSEPTDPSSPYYRLFSRKFTFLVQGGFDGWDIYREYRTNGDIFRVGQRGFLWGACPSLRFPTATGNGSFKLISVGDGTQDWANTDYYAYLMGIRTFENPEATNINVFATPGIDFVNNSNLVEETIDMVEYDRADSIYILTTPDSNLFTPTYTIDELFYPQDVVDSLEGAGIDSNYTATYYPWVLTRDTVNNTQIYIPPTAEVCRNLALTDNIAFPWFASAGYTRGLVNAIKARKKLTQEDRDTLYKGRINPIATFSDVGTVIWGNKTLQVRESALDRLNVRRLLLQARKLISAVSVRLLFEQNDQKVRQDFLDAVNPILDSIRRDRGLYDFRVTVSSSAEDLDRNQLVGKIYVKPTKSLEFIDIEFLITPTGASFDNI